MFTGIIKELGRVSTIQKTSGKTVLQISANNTFVNAKVDDSIAVNGCCLTVVELTNNIATFDVLPETLARTNLGLLEVDSLVNLEESLTITTKLGGHMLQGHIDCTATIIDYKEVGDSTIFSFNLPKNFLSMLVPKAFISIDGISLTIVEVNKDHFTVMLIPHTKAITIVKNWKKNTVVNIEIDIINKSIFHYLNNLDLFNR